MINNKISAVPFRGIVDHHIHARTDEREVIARVLAAMTARRLAAIVILVSVR
jgi:hypothetical protein